MPRPILLLPIILAASLAAAAPALAERAPAAEMLPARTLQCTLGRALDLDPGKMQSAAEIRYEGAHPFALFLPAKPRHSGPPPEPNDPPEPVDPATRILADPAGIAADSGAGLARVIDMWPDRVEAIAPIGAGAEDGQLFRLIIVSQIDPASGTASLFTTRAADAASMDLDAVYQGPCRITIGNPAPR